MPTRKPTRRQEAIAIAQAVADAPGWIYFLAGLLTGLLACAAVSDWKHLS